MKFQKTQSTSQGPSSSIGIMRFMDSNKAGPQFSYQFAFGVTIAFIAVIIAIKMMFNV